MIRDEMQTPVPLNKTVSTNLLTQENTLLAIPYKIRRVKKDEADCSSLFNPGSIWVLGPVNSKPQEKIVPEKLPNNTRR